MVNFVLQLVQNVENVEETEEWDTHSEFLNFIENTFLALDFDLNKSFLIGSDMLD
jgi:hypothetical protein